MIFKTGDHVGTYLLLEECGSGAYGSVFLAEHTVTKRRYALKIIYRNGRNCERELAGLTRYQQVCPRTNLLQIYHVEDCGEFFYYTMDPADNIAQSEAYVPDTLTNRLRQQKRLQPAAVKQMFQELMDDLHVLHQKGLFHRDIKPDNILWLGGKATLGDIGLVTDGQTTSLAGTPGFLPPEILAGTREYRAEDDYYALGKVIYCAVTGLPVSHFPAFPDSGTLTDTGELITLYNKLCSGNARPSQPVAPQAKKALPAKFVFTTAVLAALVLLPAMYIVYALLDAPDKTIVVHIRQEHESPIISTQTAPERKKAPTTDQNKKTPEPIQQPSMHKNSIRALAAQMKSEQKQKISDCREKLDQFKQKYRAASKFESLQPLLQKDFKKLEKLCDKRETEAFNRSISPEDREAAKKDPANHAIAAEPFLLDQNIRRQRQKEAQLQFDQRHQSDPVWEYFSNRKKLETLLVRLEISAGNGLPVFAEQLHQAEHFLERQRELEEKFLQKNKK